MINTQDLLTILPTLLKKIKGLKKIVLYFLIVHCSSCFQKNDNYDKSLKIRLGMKLDSVTYLMGQPIGIHVDSSQYPIQKVLFYPNETPFHAESIKIYFDVNDEVIEVSNNNH